MAPPAPDLAPELRTLRDPRAWLSEIFIAPQGEAKYQGQRQLFIRFGACPLRCQYCDQPAALVREARFRVEKSPGSGRFITYRNPVTPGSLWQALQRYRGEFPALHSASLTGGEPLVQAEFLGELIPFLRSQGLKIFLETAGVHARELGSIRQTIDVISMDVKIESTARERCDLNRHAAFLTAARGRDADCYAKIVVGENTPDSEIAAAGAMLREMAPDIDVYLQELWKVHPDDRPPRSATMERLRKVMLGFLPRVHLSRQQHKLDGHL